MSDDSNFELECMYLKESLEYSLELAISAISTIENSLYNIKTIDAEEYSSRYFFETILFTLDDIKNSLKNQINDLCSIEFDTKVNEYYQTNKSNSEEADIIPFYRTDFVDDIYVYSDDSISKVFKKTPQKIYRLFKNNDNSSENHNE